MNGRKKDTHKSKSAKVPVKEKFMPKCIYTPNTKTPRPQGERGVGSYEITEKNKGCFSSIGFTMVFLPFWFV
ncbi:hypothetical protein DVG78_06925 [Runella aurantiaca]|uniref:Uncharacterized protein n=1 Tax=Runella aurantiaca TaxID=2282308 RepID=A0A369ID95_9BACT|nr:hypothetical protein DVG78_06925 [Runella aurantiaca]